MKIPWGGIALGSAAGRVRLLYQPPAGGLPMHQHQPQDQSAIRTDLGAIFVSLELSRSTWLTTSLSPGAGEMLSKQSVAAGDVGGLLALFAQLQQKATARLDRAFPIIAIQEAGLDGFWIHRVLESEGIESHVVDAASILTSRRRRRAKTDRIDGETLVAERIDHTNRIKALLSAQGIRDYDPLRRNSRARLDQLRTGDGRPLPPRLKAQIARELDRIEMLVTQLKAVEAERDALLQQARDEASRPAAMLAQLKGIGPQIATLLWSEALFRHFNNRRQVVPTRAWRRRLGRADQSITSKACPRPATHGSERR
jgi:transposase